MKIDYSHLSLRALAKRKGVSPAAITQAYKAGAPRNPDGTFNEAEFDKFISERDARRDSSLDLRSQKLMKEIENLSVRIRLGGIEEDKARGKLHDSTSCSASLAQA